MEIRNVKIVSTGTYIPQNKVTSEQLDKKLQLQAGWTERKTGVKQRFYIKEERASQMVAKAVEAASKCLEFVTKC